MIGTDFEVFVILMYETNGDYGSYQGVGNMTWRNLGLFIGGLVFILGCTMDR